MPFTAAAAGEDQPIHHHAPSSSSSSSSSLLLIYEHNTLFYKSLHSRIWRSYIDCSPHIISSPLYNMHLYKIILYLLFLFRDQGRVANIEQWTSNVITSKYVIKHWSCSRITYIIVCMFTLFVCFPAFRWSVSCFSSLICYPAFHHKIDRSTKHQHSLYTISISYHFQRSFFSKQSIFKAKQSKAKHINLYWYNIFIFNFFVLQKSRKRTNTELR